MISNKLDEDEKTIIVIRKHWFVFVLQITVLAFAALIPLVVAVFLPLSVTETFANVGVGLDLFIFLYVLYLLALWILTFIYWTVYYLDAWVVTNRRVIDIEQRGLFVRDITSLMLDKVQDVTVEINGIFPTLLGYGTLVLHTAGDNKDIRIKLAAHPQYARDKIMECQRSHASSGRT